MPCGSGLAHTDSVCDDSARSELSAGSAQSQDSLHEDPEVVQNPRPASGPRISFAHSGPEYSAAQEPEDNDEDDGDSLFEPQVVDKTLYRPRLFNYVYDKLIDSLPLTNLLAPPLCEFEFFFSVSKPQSAARPRLCIYLRVNELVAQSGVCASKLAHESKPLFKVITLRRKVFPVAYQPDYTSPLFLNPDFARISNNRFRIFPPCPHLLQLQPLSAQDWLTLCSPSAGSRSLRMFPVPCRSLRVCAFGYSWFGIFSISIRLLEKVRVS